MIYSLVTTTIIYITFSFVYWDYWFFSNHPDRVIYFLIVNILFGLNEQLNAIKDKLDEGNKQ
jgi:hypothetical protein